MTANQIAYWNYVETKRSNQAKERLTGEANAETRRSNIARETENMRSNLAREAENLRSNQTNELIARSRAREEARANRAKESISAQTLGETVRSNKAKEQLTGQSTNVQRMSVMNQRAANRNQAALIAENKRHNLVAERQAVADLMVNNVGKLLTTGISVGGRLI